MGAVRAGGLTWNLEAWGAGGAGAPALLLLHGFTGRGRGWRLFAELLSRDRLCLAPDLPGHGATDAPPAAFDFAAAASALRDLLEAHAASPAAVVGYSMGGRLALQLAVSFPGAVDRLVLVGASPGIESETERAARRLEDEAWARRIEDGYEEFVEAWMAQPLFAGGPELPAPRLEELRREKLSHDPARLAAALRALGAGRQSPLHGRLAEVAAPSLFVAGERDSKYRAIAEGMKTRMPRATVRIIAGAGHAPHIDAPDLFISAVAPFLGTAAAAWKE